MKKLKLQWPLHLNLRLLSALGEDALMKLVALHAHKKLRERRMCFPSHKTAKKCTGHALYSIVLRGEVSWDEVKAELKEKQGPLNALGLTLTNCKRFYKQHEHELAKEASKKSKQ
jgi:hypothetical protein